MYRYFFIGGHLALQNIILVYSQHLPLHPHNGKALTPPHNQNKSISIKVLSSFNIPDLLRIIKKGRMVHTSKFLQQFLILYPPLSNVNQKFINLSFKLLEFVDTTIFFCIRKVNSLLLHHKARKVTIIQKHYYRKVFLFLKV